MQQQLEDTGTQGRVHCTVNPLLSIQNPHLQVPELQQFSRLTLPRRHWSVAFKFLTAVPRSIFTRSINWQLCFPCGNGPGAAGTGGLSIRLGLGGGLDLESVTVGELEGEPGRSVSGWRRHHDPSPGPGPSRRHVTQ